MNAAGSSVEEYVVDQEPEYIGYTIGNQFIKFIDPERQEKWDRRFLEFAKLVSEASKDPSTKCGAVIVNPLNNQIIASGYNGFPRGCDDSEELYENRDLKLSRVVHAETNACLQAGFDRANGCTIYTWPAGIGPSCDRCTTNIIQVGIKRVVHYKDETTRFSSAWAEASQRGLDMYKEANVEVVHY